MMTGIDYEVTGKPKWLRQQEGRRQSRQMAARAMWRELKRAAVDARRMSVEMAVAPRWRHSVERELHRHHAAYTEVMH